MSFLLRKRNEIASRQLLDEATNGPQRGTNRGLVAFCNTSFQF